MTSDYSALAKDIVALTGTIGSGKSTVAIILENLGAKVISADKLAREVVKPGSPGLEQIVDCFGSEILTSQGSLNRKKLAEVVFSDLERRTKLEGITHPLIKQLAEERFRKAIANDYPLIIYDVPLLFEAGLEKEGFKAIVVVTADEDKCIERIKKRSGLSEEEIRKRISSQLSAEEKISRADFVIDNSSTEAKLEEQTNNLYTDLLAF